MKRVDGKPQLKDTEKGYVLTAKCIKVFNRMGRLLLWNEVKEISHNRCCEGTASFRWQRNRNRPPF